MERLIHLIATVMKNILYKMSQYEPIEPFGEDISVKVDLSSDATKADLKEQLELIRLM